MLNSVFSIQYSVFSGFPLPGGEGQGEGGRFPSLEQRVNLQPATSDLQPSTASNLQPATCNFPHSRPAIRHSTLEIRHSGFPLPGGEGRGEGEPFNLQPSTFNLQLPSTRTGFTLIELLVVIAIIALLAALVMPITYAVNRVKIRSKTQAEMAQLETAIQGYKAKRGFYPPDNEINALLNPLFYELSGTTFADPTYTTLDGSSSLTVSAFAAVFPNPNGQKVTGFVNTTRGGGDEGITAEKFIRELKPGQIGDYNGGRFLVASVGWTGNSGSAPISGTTLNPWRYNSSNPTNNPGTYDLWVDVNISGKTNRICNWSKEALIQ